MKNTTTISIDLAKNVFQVAVFNRHGKLKSNQKMSAKKLGLLVTRHPEANICMEACGSAHHWGRRFIKEGHEVYLVPAHIAAKYRSGNKNDPNDALAIYEAAKRPETHFVAVRTLAQQDLASQHKLRQGYMKQRTQLANRMRGFALEYGVKFPKGISQLRRHVPEALEAAENELTMIARSILRNLLEQLLSLDVLIKEITQALTWQTRQLPACRELFRMPGIGWLGAGALYAKFGDGAAFRRGRDASASVGLVPGHRGTGGHNKTTGISKRGDKYLHYLLVHGARSAVSNVGDKQDGLSCWIRRQRAMHSINNTSVALANKLLRMAWAILSSGGQYRVPVAQ
ncbi:MAG: IS110 family transposase [Candidatus Thiodiazotropha endolucinida]